MGIQAWTLKVKAPAGQCLLRSTPQRCTLAFERVKGHRQAFLCSNHPKWPTFLNSTTVAIRFPWDFWKDQTLSLHDGRSQCDLLKECDCPLSGCISAMLFTFPRSLGYYIFIIISSKLDQHQVKWQIALSDTDAPPPQSRFFPAAPLRVWNTDLSVQPQPLQATSPPSAHTTCLLWEFIQPLAFGVPDLRAWSEVLQIDKPRDVACLLSWEVGAEASWCGCSHLPGAEG